MLPLRKANMNLFFTLFDCLERKFDQIEMNSIRVLLNFGNSELFRRVISHYNNAGFNEEKAIMKEMLYQDVDKQTTSILES